MAIGVDFIYGVMQLLKLIPKGAEADANDYIDMLGQLFEFVHLEIFFIIILTSTQSYLSISYILAMTLSERLFADRRPQADDHIRQQRRDRPR